MWLQVRRGVVAGEECGYRGGVWLQVRRGVAAGEEGCGCR